MKQSSEQVNAKKITAEVVLALGASKPKKVAGLQLPSDEELAALLEGNLDVVRRAQVIEALAHDSASFNRWAALVEANEVLGFVASEQLEAAGKEASTGLFQRLSNFVREQFLGLSFAGVASAAAVILLVNNAAQTDYATGVNSLYADFGESWDEKPVARINTRSVNTIAQAKNLPPADQVLLEGIAEGLEKLGDDFYLKGINATGYISTDKTALDEDQVALLKALGNLATLSQFKCILSGEAEYFTKTEPMLLDLLSSLNSYNDKTSISLAKLFESNGSAEARVCRFSKEVIKRVSTENF